MPRLEAGIMVFFLVLALAVIFTLCLSPVLANAGASAVDDRKVHQVNEKLLTVENYSGEDLQTDTIVHYGVSWNGGETNYSVFFNSKLMWGTFAYQLRNSTTTGFKWIYAALWLFQTHLKDRIKHICPTGTLCELYQAKGLFRNLQVRTPFLEWRHKPVEHYATAFRNKEDCDQDSFACDSKQCIKQEYKCNGAADCDDGSDEETTLCDTVNEFKPGRRCKFDEYRCHSSQCIDAELICNYAVDCYDGSDEFRKSCSYTPPLEPEETTYFPYSVENLHWVKGCWLEHEDLSRPHWYPVSLDRRRKVSYLCRFSNQSSSYPNSSHVLGRLEIFFGGGRRFENCFYRHGQKRLSLPFDSPSEVLTTAAKMYWAFGEFQGLNNGIILGGLLSSYEIFFICKFPFHYQYHESDGTYSAIIFLAGTLDLTTRLCKSASKDHILSMPRYKVLWASGFF